MFECPLVSIVIPCYNGARYLPEAIESCQRQTYPNIEILVVDDASPDDCAEIAERYARTDKRICVLHRAQNGRVSRAFNTGYEAAQGEYFTRLAQDDIFREDAVEMMVTHLRTHPEVGLVYCDIEVVDANLNPIEYHKMASPEDALKGNNDIGTCVMWPRSVWEKVGCFDPDFDTAEDYEYWLRIKQHYPIDRCPRGAPIYVRRHEDMGTRRFAVQQAYAHARASCRYSASPAQRALAMSRAHFEASDAYRRSANYLKAWQAAWQSVIAMPSVPLYWKAALGATLRVFWRGGASGKAHREA